MTSEDSKREPIPDLSTCPETGAGRLYLRPLGLIDGPAAAAALASGKGRPLAGGRFVFTLCEIIQAKSGERGEVSYALAVLSLAETLDWAGRQEEDIGQMVEALIDRLSASRPPVAGLSLDCPPGAGPLVMGIVNVTPDSFSDGGDHADPDSAIAHGLALMEAGADILDIGGESTRPGAEAVPVEEELRRVIPVIRGLADRGAVLSIDTRRARVMSVALEAGANIINDVSALAGDPESLKVAAVSGAPVVLMHMHGDPRTMQENPTYDCAPLDVYDYLGARIDACARAGIDPSRIVVDPGIGFGKTFDHNSEILGWIALYHGLGCGVMIGASRKSFVAALSRGEPPKKRLPGSLAAALAAADEGVQILRVHDVGETKQALAVWDALRPHG